MDWMVDITTINPGINQTERIKMKQETIKVEQISSCIQTREINPHFVEELIKSIKTNGYKAAFPLSVIPADNGFKLFNGNHRLAAIRKLGIKEVSVIIQEPADDDQLMKRAYEENRASETALPMTFLDDAENVTKLSKQGKTLSEIAELLNLDLSEVSRLRGIMGLPEEALNLIKNSFETKYKKLQESDSKSFQEDFETFQTVDWQLGWFQSILPLSPANQTFIVKRIVEEKGKLRGGRLIQECKKLREYERLTQILEECLNPAVQNREQIISEITADIYKGIYSEDYLRQRIDALNRKAQNRLDCGNCLSIIPTYSDKSIDIVLTDPPYGQNFVSHRRMVNNEVTVPIVNDTPEEAFALLDKMCGGIKHKLKDNAFIYIFCSIKTLFQTVQITSKHFGAFATVLIWDKLNKGSGDLDIWGGSYEMIVFHKIGNRKVNKRLDNVIRGIPRLAHSDCHPAEKPVELMEYILRNSGSSNDTVCDPFMGVGAVPLAAQKLGWNYYGVELVDKYFKITKRRMGI